MAREVSGTSSAWGLLAVFLGLIAIFAPVLASAFIALLVGILMLTVGVVGIVYAFKAPSFGTGVWRFLFGGVGVVFGLAMMVYPGRGMMALTVLLGIFFAVDGILKIVFAFKARPEEGWGWVLFGGIVSVLMAVLIYAGWPITGMWAVGVFTGIWMLTMGLAMTSFGASSARLITDVQDSRIAALEDTVYRLAIAMASLQSELAGAKAQVKAIGDALETKVAAAEVDPVIVSLNEKLKEARRRFQELSQMADEARKARQQELEELVDCVYDALEEQ